VRPAIAVLAASAAVAGCGGGGAMSATDYRKAASKICDDANRRAAAVGRPRNIAGLRGYLDRTLAIVQDDTDRLRALHPPDNLKSGHEAALKAQDAAVQRLRALLHELETSKPPVTELRAALAEVQRRSDEADRRFRAIGLQHCAQ
jgi:hypothetical protein